MSKELDLKLFGQQIWSPTDKKEYRSKLAGLGIFINVIWVLSVFIRPIIDPILFLTLGGIGFIISSGTRLQSRKLRSQTASEVSGGSIIGYVISWFIVHLGYPNKTYQIVINPKFIFTVNQILIFFLIGIFVVWFAIPASRTLEEVIFNFSPLISYFILNLWKLAVILEILTLLEELKVLDPYADIIFLTIGFVELVLQYIRLFKLPIVDIILDPMQLLSKIIDGPLQTLKWSFLVILFLIIDILPLDLISMGLIAFSLTMGLASLTTSISKIALDSGIIQSRTENVVEEGKVIIPQVFDELKQLEASNLQEFYRVSEQISVRKRDKVINYNVGDLVLKLPFTNTLEEKAGIFLATLKFNRASTTKTRKRISRKSTVQIKTKTKTVTLGNNKKRKSINISSLHRIPYEEWEEIIKKDQIESMDPAIVTSMMGYDSPEEFEKVVEKGIRKAISIQENVRDRIRGVPVTGSMTKSKVIKLKNRHIEVPDEFLEMIKSSEDQEIELIPGKEEFLFYARIKKRKGN
ncbi:MAG: hypothetical protein JSW11_08400 [Candidatus Heimdallarchaeota archaeon]|nr:MAG: hypothetical protein JSW11_08400 [Candidatus Heimdallarchaeota archaeon]